MCCPGCQAVAEAIVAAGLEDYYRYRTAPADGPAGSVPHELTVYDQPQVQAGFVQSAPGDEREASLFLEGIVCAACVWLNERHVRGLPGVLEFHVNLATHRAWVRWDGSRLKLSAILEAIAAIGYRAHPYDPARHEAAQRAERQALLKRLAVAGLMMMQVMMLAWPFYESGVDGVDPGLAPLLIWSQLLLTLPALLYSAAPIWRAAWRDLRHGQAGMDVPVSLALAGAFVFSAWHAARGSGELYFDSISMFVFLLLGSRYLELLARQRAARRVESLARSQPALAQRLLPDGGEESVPAIALHPGDRVRVRPGAAIPADGVVREGEGGVDESLLTGEAQAVPRGPGVEVLAGSLVLDQPLVIEVHRVGADTTLSAIGRLAERAQVTRPALAQTADRVAGWVVLGILLLAGITALYWEQTDPARTLGATLAVLVVTCPCALSLATPAALAATLGALLERGLLVTQGRAIEALARSGRMVFDKTGTLTAGRPALNRVDTLGTCDKALALRVAAALAAHSDHPLARALRDPAVPVASAAEAATGQGVSGVVDGQRWWLGRRGYAHRAGPDPALPATPGSEVWLGNDKGLAARFSFHDPLRDHALPSLEALRRLGLRLNVLSGDQPAAVASLTATLPLESARGGLLPEEKLAAVRQWQAAGETVAMTGDGINDAPVLAGADVSIAMGGGARLAAARADIVLLNDRLDRLPAAVRLSRRAMRVIRQNLWWALAYNLVAVPFAAAGWITPWAAALGMSASSLLVVANALRLR